ncbi:MAG: hypothetical protein USCAAHI_00203 [Beijerinckiaceae bacterium]|jgi:hypothetical protein|nr:MAG: hypothetical protein USCAAHI_00203 [Beijerinckiaceae bacterium]
MPRQKPRIVVITIREDENAAVVSRVSELGFYPGKHRTYKLRSVDHRTKGSYPIAIFRATEQGPNKAQNVARNAIEDLDPEFIVLAGIAGGVPSKEFTLGDVVVATRLHDFLPDAPPQLINQGGPMTNRVQDLVTLLPALEKDLAGWQSPENIKTPRPAVIMADKAFYGEDAWQKKTKESLEFHLLQQKRADPIVTARAVAPPVAISLRTLRS